MEIKINGTFNGVGMLSEDGRIYPINPNYISKSRLVVGDKLQLYSFNGSLIYKRIESVPQKRVLGIVGDNDEVLIGGTPYKTVHASITHFHLNPGDEVFCIIPEDGESFYAAIDDKIISQDEEH